MASNTSKQSMTSNSFGMFDSIMKPQTAKPKSEENTEKGNDIKTETVKPIKITEKPTIDEKEGGNKKIASFTIPENVEKLIMAGSMVYKLKGNKSAYITNLIKQDYESKKSEYDLFLTML